VHYETPVPFGQDRLIPIWIATLAVQQKSRTIHFETALQMLDFFRLAPDGRHYRRVVQGFQQIFAATIFFGTQDHPDANLLVDSSRFHFFDKCAAAHLSNMLRVQLCDGQFTNVSEK
jgi:hypothetical protein